MPGSFVHRPGHLQKTCGGPNPKRRNPCTSDRYITRNAPSAIRNTCGGNRYPKQKSNSCSYRLRNSHSYCYMSEARIVRRLRLPARPSRPPPKMAATERHGRHPSLHPASRSTYRKSAPSPLNIDSSVRLGALHLPLAAGLGIPQILYFSLPRIASGALTTPGISFSISRCAALRNSRGRAIL